MRHLLYQTGDAGAPNSIKDRNGEVVLQQCKVCGFAERELALAAECSVGVGAIALYEAPFYFKRGYIFDAKHRMVADDAGQDAIARVRGWGRISYLPDAERLQDAVGALVAEALTAYWKAQQ